MSLILHYIIPYTVHISIVHHQEQVECDGQGQIQVIKYKEAKCKECARWFKPLTISDEDGTILRSLSGNRFESSNTPIAEQSSATNAVLKSPITITVPTKKDIFISATIIDSGGNVKGDFQNVRVPFTETSLLNTWTQQTESSKKSQLTLNYRLVRCSDHFTGDKCDQCEDNYHTDRCNVECAPAEGNYTCDESTGGRICESGKIGVNCDQCEDGNKVGKDCATCKTGFIGKECDSCAQNYYPVGTCTVFCEPEQEKYKCLESGAKECLGNRTGDECEECRLNYYGRDCEKFCKSSTSFTCDQTGSKNCRHNYFNPEKECDSHSTVTPHKVATLVTQTQVKRSVNQER